MIWWVLGCLDDAIAAVFGSSFSSAPVEKKLVFISWHYLCMRSYQTSCQLLPLFDSKQIYPLLLSSFRFPVAIFFFIQKRHRSNSVILNNVLLTTSRGMKNSVPLSFYSIFYKRKYSIKENAKYVYLFFTTKGLLAQLRWKNIPVSTLLRTLTRLLTSTIGFIFFFCIFYKTLNILDVFTSLSDIHTLRCR